MISPLDDHALRNEALDISHSFIVQAPAGSGKTGLLILRFLKLLIVSEKPEQVLAITFTRKAASEMRDRILTTLHWAKDLEKAKIKPENDFDLQRFEIAKKALARDQEMQWQLLENPSRLRIQTIDSFCFNISSQLPILSRAGVNPRISEQVELCFRDAISNTLHYLESKQSISEDIEKVLVHLDNDIGKIERLLLDLLKNRDQWLSYVLEINSSSNDAKAYTEACIEELVEESILEVRTELEPYEKSLIELTNFSLNNLKNLDPPKHYQIEKLDQLPGKSVSDITHWQPILDLLLTNSGGWRKKVDRRNGFPAENKTNKNNPLPYKKRKEEIITLLERLSGHDDLLKAANYLRLLPSSKINNKQWSFLVSLTRVLVSLSSELVISFRKFGLIDYIEIAAAARTALGSTDNPTDLALSLDLSIQHILIDEFQDTSQIQLDILQQLISGWTPDDKRSLFMVGDAMQSCYGFRNANVGIYLNVQQNGLPQIKVKSLQLQTNFRSNGGIVEWINRHFYSAFPSRPNPSLGAVPFSKSVAINPKPKSFSVSTELISYENSENIRAKEEEACQVVNAILEIRKKSADDSIAILTRSRSHLTMITSELRNRKIEWLSTDIDRMGAMQVTEDLLSLTKALLNPYDRLSWLSIMHAPWTGLLISDIHAVAQGPQQYSIWAYINEPKGIKNISNDGKKRLNDFIECVNPAMQYRYRTSLRELVQTCWELLRGAAVIKNRKEQTCAAEYFNLLDEHESAGGINNLEYFQEQVYNSFIPDLENSNLSSKFKPIQILTMHKAKGLEFDHVIIPGLANTPGSDEKSLFTWHERLNKCGEPKLFIAARTETGAEDDELYRLIRHEKQNKTLLENTRLLYIAITRAKKSAKLLGTIFLNKKKELKIPSQSLLSCIWRELNRESLDFKIQNVNCFVRKSTPPNPTLLSHSTPVTRLRQTKGLTQEERNYLKSKDQNIVYEKTEEHKRENYRYACTGDLIHEFLESYVHSKNKNLFLRERERFIDYWKLKLENFSETTDELNKSLCFIEETIKKTTSNEDLKWIFDNSITDSRSEFSISAIQNGQPKTYIIDRTFIDKENIRWIIDYKTGNPDNQNEPEFVERQSKIHAPQLNQYKALFNKLESRKIKTALLFTAIPKLVEI